MDKMKKRVVLTVLLAALLLVSAGSANANIFKDFLGSITGMVTGEPATVSEQVQCSFANSETAQNCYTDDKKFECSGITSCTLDVFGGEGAKLNWKSSCGSYATTILDGVGETILFKCETTTTTTTPSILSTTITVPILSVNEKVTCRFTGSGAAQHCYTDDGRFKCAGTASCTADVSGGEGTKLNWKSTCGGYASNILDGADDSVEFVCPVSTTTTILPIAIAKEQVKCVFTNSAGSETCFTTDGNFKCAGTGSCTADVSGYLGYKVEWKSSCTDKAQYTIFDGTGETIMFVCQIFTATTSTTNLLPTPAAVAPAVTKTPAQTVAPTITATPAAVAPAVTKTPAQTVAPTVTAIPVAIAPATGAPAQYVSCPAGCYCLAKAKAEQESFVPCGGALQQCAQGDMFCYKPATTTTTLPVRNVRLHFFYWRDNCPLCDSEKQFLEQMKQKYPQMQYTAYDANPPAGAQYSIMVTVFLQEGLPTLFFDNKVWETYSDSIAQEIEDKIKYCLGNACSSDPSFDPQIAYVRIEEKYNITDVEKRMSSPLKAMVAPSIEHPTTVEEGPIIDKVQCIFLNSDVLINPDTAKKEKCYSEKSGCVWDGMVASDPSIPEKYAYCYTQATGERGENIVWKSSCGGYSTTVIDGNPDKVIFQCVPSTNVTQAQITGKGFNKAYWQCYDGEEQTSSAQCLSSEGWQEHASKFCSGHCKNYEDLGITKCGVNSFGVTDECYSEQAQQVTAQLANIFAVESKPEGGAQATETAVTSTQRTEKQQSSLTGKKITLPPDAKIGDAGLLYFYSAGCCAGMDLEVDKAVSMLGIKSKKIDINSQPGLAEGYKVTEVPTMILLRYEPAGLKEYSKNGNADAATIVEWVKGITNGGGGGGSLAVQAEQPKEEMLICKDSCPSEGKCYPFGYRKDSDFCSDSGAFVAQFGDNAKCDNSFECKTNFCVDGECIGQGMWQKFMGWFKKLFG